MHAFKTVGKRRYANDQTKRHERIWRGRLHKLCRRRYGNHHLPDDASGRAMLTALLRFGLGVEAAMEDAPWIEAAEIEMMQRTARRMTWKDAGALMIQLTYAERQACKLWLFAPCDVPMDEVRRRQIKRRMRADRERKRHKRQRQREGLQEMRNTNKRDEAILRMLAMPSLPTSQREGANIYRIYGPNWTPVSALVEEAKHCTAFRCPDGWKLRNLRDAVHCTVKHLAAQGAVKTMLRPGRRGPVLCVAPGKADTFSDRRSVGPGCDAENAGPAMVSLVKRTEKRLSAPYKKRAGGHASISTSRPEPAAPPQGRQQKNITTVRALPFIKALPAESQQTR